MAQILAFQPPRLVRDGWLGSVPELPRPMQRWTAGRKRAVIDAVRRGWRPIEEVCEPYNISVDEFISWERDMDKYGVPGLRATRLQIYRDADRARRGK